ncbi:hypothetical protein J2S14_004306 [Lederbergia wuyishanensis]|uniref:Uncharacterized protein n=1 Tax=Lederbergia wuyishanensis TaxID=1347903 RepID=A0ABU0DAM7_9BACI|nr:hypothetical protein [Lederbergia wuyishanensis]
MYQITAIVEVKIPFKKVIPESNMKIGFDV